MSKSAVVNFEFEARSGQAYEQMMGRWSRILAPLFIQFSGIADGDRVLDVGCGTGSLTFVLPAAANVDQVAAIDRSDVYVEYARFRNTDPRISIAAGASARGLHGGSGSMDVADPQRPRQPLPRSLNDCQWGVQSPGCAKTTQQQVPESMRWTRACRTRQFPVSGWEINRRLAPIQHDLDTTAPNGSD